MADDLEVRAARHAALGDPIRLAVVDALALSDRSPLELRRMLGIESNLMAHHLDVLEEAGLVTRSRSSGDGRRRYVRLVREALRALPTPRAVQPQPALFVCTANSARSQLAAALWRSVVGAPAASAGTHPAVAVHRGAVDAARRHRLDLGDDPTPRRLDAVARPALVVTVCDQAHEELGGGVEAWHWSIADPVPVGTIKAFDATVTELRQRIVGLVAS